FVRAFFLFIVPEVPVGAAMADPAVSVVRILRREPDHLAPLLVRPPFVREQVPLAINRRDKDIAVAVVALRETGVGVAREAHHNTGQGHVWILCRIRSRMYQKSV